MHIPLPINAGVRRPQVLLHVPCLGRLAGKYEYHNGPSLSQIQDIFDFIVHLHPLKWRYSGQAHLNMMRARKRLDRSIQGGLRPRKK